MVFSVPQRGRWREGHFKSLSRETLRLCVPSLSGKTVSSSAEKQRLSHGGNQTSHIVSSYCFHYCKLRLQTEWERPDRLLLSSHREDSRFLWLPEGPLRLYGILPFIITLSAMRAQLHIKKHTHHTHSISALIWYISCKTEWFRGTHIRI